MMSFQKIYSPTQLANAMKLVRQQNGWTQSELAKKIGIKQATISNFENNPDNTSLTTFFKILQSLELSMTLCDTKNASPLPTDFPENVVTAVETNVLRLHGRLSREYGSK
ncbi:type II toxin-antitoxin system antitoxin HipB [Escherichia coli]|nr:type II toxin-antitoxin system antitoxin HipB [Escherichia coli]EFI1481994.1 type II toxin-antitoxin system antitoxin HipB [Escherichia coli]